MLYTLYLISSTLNRIKSHWRSLSKDSFKCFLSNKMLCILSCSCKGTRSIIDNNLEHMICFQKEGDQHSSQNLDSKRMKNHSYSVLNLELLQFMLQWIILQFLPYFWLRRLDQIPWLHLKAFLLKNGHILVMP